MNIADRSRMSFWLLACMLLAALVVVVLNGFGLNHAARLEGPVSPASNADCGVQVSEPSGPEPVPYME